tara:strand:- start:376 stop:2655 length:2280 start_codon:yes stop_codon:yes gene_type:complete
MNSIDFFNKSEFELLKKTSGQNCDRMIKELDDAYADLKKAYRKVEYWAKSIQVNIFPYGSVEIRQRPTNQGNKFDGYLWAKIYPTMDDLNEKWLAFTVGIDDEFNYVIKIDTVGQNANSKTRKNYENFRGDFNNSKIVKLYNLNSFSNWEELFEQSQKDLNELNRFYSSIKENEHLQESGGPFSNFKSLLDKLKETMSVHDSVLKNFQLKNYSSKSYYVKIADHKNIIGNPIAHYEIRNLKSGLSVELHFEGDEISKKSFQRIKLPDGIEWFPWLDSKSIRVIDKVNIEDANVVNQLINNLLKLEESIGPNVRNIIIREDVTEMKEKNQILFGPPGTGKTYITKDLALKILGFDTLEMSREQVKENYDKKVDEGQIVFTTFHQSMSYEDFVEGIKPETTEGEKLSYPVKAGIFKTICTKAEDSYLDSIKGISEELPFDEAFKKLKEEWEQNEHIKFSMKSEGYDFTIVGFTEKSIQFRKSSGGMGHTLSISTLRDGYYGTRKIRNTGVGIYYPGVLEKLKGYKPVNNSSVKNIKNYILIIDEINRGNVSAIFGELITLLEPDKRLNAAEQITLELPYSKGESFGVPPNLYIIGTMNTADRSVEALDSALRRRFSFIEMPPVPSYIKEFGESENGYIDDIDLAKLLETINKRVEKLLDRDHAIGHSYFLKVKNLKQLKAVFANKVIPLLQEYFFGDYGKIGLVLGSGFVKSIQDNNEDGFFASFEDYDLGTLLERKVYRIKDATEMNNEEFKKALLKLIR